MYDVISIDIFVDFLRAEVQFMQAFIYNRSYKIYELYIIRVLFYLDKVTSGQGSQELFREFIFCH